MASKERSQTPVSISATSSSSEEDLVSNVQSLYHIVDQPEDFQVGKKNLTQLPSIDPLILADLEEQAHAAAKSLSWMTKYLVSKLNEMSHITVQTTTTYGEAVHKASSQVEDNIRMMYSLMAKCEELDRKMKPVYEIQAQVEEIKKQLDVLESSCR